MLPIGTTMVWTGPVANRMYGDYSEIRPGDKFIVTHEQMAQWSGGVYKPMVIMGPDGRKSYIHYTEHAFCSALEGE